MALGPTHVPTASRAGTLRLIFPERLTSGSHLDVCRHLKVNRHKPAHSAPSQDPSLLPRSLPVLHQGVPAGANPKRGRYPGGLLSPWDLIEPSATLVGLISKQTPDPPTSLHTHSVAWPAPPRFPPGSAADRSLRFHACPLIHVLLGSLGALFTTRHLRLHLATTLQIQTPSRILKSFITWPRPPPGPSSAAHTPRPPRHFHRGLCTGCPFAGKLATDLHTAKRHLPGLAFAGHPSAGGPKRPLLLHSVSILCPARATVW